MSYSDEVVKFAEDYVDFLNKSKSPWHVVNSVREDLLSNGFIELDLSSDWNLKPKGRYMIQKGGSTLIAFALGGNWKPDSPLAICAPHSDSPSLRVKPYSARGNLGYLEVGAAQYGGGLWHTWFDKDLGLAGRVFVRNGTKIDSKLVSNNKPIAKIASLAIHFDSSMNTSFTFNHEDQLLPIIGLSEGYDENKRDITQRHHPILLKLLADSLGCAQEDILEFDLNLTDVEPACIGGVNNDFIFAQNQDNQISSFACYRSLLSAVNKPAFNNLPHGIIYATYDHEEIGNKSDVGASSDFTVQVLTKITTAEHYASVLDRSVALSADVDHAVNPNYASWYEKSSQPTLNGGPVLKYNPRMEFATTGIAAAFSRIVGERSGVPLQSTIPMNGKRTGSTHGPSISSLLGIVTFDLGPPILAMHSIRETSGLASPWQMYKYTECFFLDFSDVLKMFNEFKKNEKSEAITEKQGPSVTVRPRARRFY
ncbi:hypothetical protein ACOME3_000947 [Neoechinorhynchus agilis]